LCPAGTRRGLGGRFLLRRAAKTGSIAGPPICDGPRGVAPPYLKAHTGEKLRQRWLYAFERLPVVNRQARELGATACQGNSREELTGSGARSGASGLLCPHLNNHGSLERAIFNCRLGLVHPDRALWLFSDTSTLMVANELCHPLVESRTNSFEERFSGPAIEGCRHSDAVRMANRH